MAVRTEQLDRDHERLNEAIRFAVEAHAGQLRKGTQLPYIVHPMEVLAILAGMGASFDVMIAGVLHDCIEDAEVGREEIAAQFGEKVADMVAAHSEKKELPWEERKAIALDELEAADPDFQKMVLADKLSNMRAIARDLKKVGDELWNRFHAPKEKQSWYYSESIDALEALQFDDMAEEYFWELNDLYKDVFVEYYYDPVDQRMFQKALHEDYCHVFERGECIWYEGDKLPADLVPVDKLFAERMESNWTEEMMDVSLGPVS